MAQDAFGDLREWGRVLTLMKELRDSHLLDEHQNGLARVLRFRRNWQLRTQTLLCATEIRQASDILIAEVLNILVSEDVDLEARILAAEALAHLIPRRPAQATTLFDEQRVVQTMDDLLKRQGPPVLQRAVAGALATVRAAKAG